jgi:ureidoglycolate dehydrogenase (NAD+)
MNQVVHIAKESIASFFRDAFDRIRCQPEVYEPTIEALIEASLRGVDSHGIRLMPHYIDEALAGRINLSPRLRFQQTSPTTVLVDADDTFGAFAAKAAMLKCVDMAAGFGMGCAAVANSTHFGSAAIYALAAARAGMIGLSFTNSDALVIPYNGKYPFLGTNPVCFAAPCEGEEPFCLDMATSAISWNKVRMQRISGLPLEAGWAADGSGEPCTDPHAAVALLPSGGYKGYGLAFMVEILCSLLTGMPFGRHITPMFPVNRDRRKIGHALIAIDIRRFQDLGVFAARMRELMNEARSQPAKSGSPVRVANDPEKECQDVRSRSGIPVSSAELAEFNRIASTLGLEIAKLGGR